MVKIRSFAETYCSSFHSRYIGTEFIFYVVSPVFLLALRRSPLFGFMLTVAVCLVSSLMNTFTMVQYNFPPTQMLWTQPEIFSPDYIQHHLVIYIKVIDGQKNYKNGKFSAVVSYRYSPLLFY